MANISLKRLFEAEDFQAKSKQTGKLVHFKSKDSYQAALKAGTHEDPKAEKGDAPKASAKPNDMFGGDYSKDRGGEAPKSDMGVDKVVYNKRTKTVGIVRMADERGETKTDADGNVNTSELEPYNPMKYPHQKDAKVAPSTQKEVDARGLWNPFAQTQPSAPKADVKSIVKDLLKKGDKEFRGAYKLKDVVDDFKDNIDDTDEDGKELKARLDKGEDGTYVQTDETEGTVVFNDGSQYQFAHVEDGPIPVTKVGKEEPNTSSKLTSMLPKKASQLNYKHSNIVADTVNKEAGLDGYAQTDDNSGAIMYNGSKGDTPTYTLYFGMNDDYGKPDEFRVSLLSTYGNDPSNIDSLGIDKSFKSSEDAMKFMTAVAKKYKKELEMDDED